jgi:hypothetical protein
MFDGTNWIEVAGLPAPRWGVAAAALGSYIYVIGGWDANSVLTNSVYKFDGTNWTTSIDVPEIFWSAVFPGGRPTATTLGDYIYVTDNNVMYRFDGDTWTKLMYLPTIQKSSAIATLDSSVYVCGGVASSNVVNYTDGMPLLWEWQDINKQTVLQLYQDRLVAPSNTIDLGSLNMPFRDLYLGSNSIYMAGIKITNLFASWAQGVAGTNAQARVAVLETNTVTLAMTNSIINTATNLAAGAAAALYVPKTGTNGFTDLVYSNASDFLPASTAIPSTNGFTDLVYSNASDFATAAQGDKADEAITNNYVGDVVIGGTVSGSNGTATNHFVTVGQWEGGLSGNVDIYATGTKTTNFTFSPTGQTYTCTSAGNLSTQTVLTADCQTNGAYLFAWICTNASYPEAPEQTIGGMFYASEDMPRTLIGIVETYRVDVATGVESEWGDGGATITVLGGTTTPAQNLLAIPAKTVSTNAFYLMGKFKRTGGTANAGDEFFVGVGTNFPTHLTFSIQTSLLLAPYAKKNADANMNMNGYAITNVNMAKYTVVSNSTKFGTVTFDPTLSDAHYIAPTNNVVLQPANGVATADGVSMVVWIVSSTNPATGSVALSNCTVSATASITNNGHTLVMFNLPPYSTNWMAHTLKSP